MVGVQASGWSADVHVLGLDEPARASVRSFRIPARASSWCARRRSHPGDCERGGRERERGAVSQSADAPPRDVRTAVQAGLMPAGDQGDPGSGAPAARRLAAMLRRKPLTPRRAAVIIATYTVLVTCAGGLVAWLTDRNNFHSLGDGLWWALQTVTTVGYGDVVPHSGTSRVIGAVVMISGIAFLTVITAAVTAALIEAARRRQPPAPDRDRLSESMQQVTTRLSAIEARLDELGPRAGS
jgi:voltage-gated potassium channel